MPAAAPEPAKTQQANLRVKTNLNAAAKEIAQRWRSRPAHTVTGARPPVEELGSYFRGVLGLPSMFVNQAPLATLWYCVRLDNLLVIQVGGG